MGFVSVMKKIGSDIDKVFTSSWFQTGVHIAEGVVGMAVPALGPVFNLTANAVMTTEANFAAIGKSSGTGPQKLSQVIQTSGGLITQALQVSGVKNVTQQTVSDYISAVVAILNAAPATAPASAPAPAAPPAS